MSTEHMQAVVDMAAKVSDLGMQVEVQREEVLFSAVELGVAVAGATTLLTRFARNPNRKVSLVGGASLAAVSLFSSYHYGSAGARYDSLCDRQDGLAEEFAELHRS